MYVCIYICKNNVMQGWARVGMCSHRQHTRVEDEQIGS